MPSIVPLPAEDWLAENMPSIPSPVPQNEVGELISQRAVAEEESLPSGNIDRQRIERFLAFLCARENEITRRLQSESSLKFIHWDLVEDPKNWVMEKHRLVESTPWQHRLTGPMLRVNHDSFRAAIDIGGVSKVVFNQHYIPAILESELKFFRNDGCYLLPEDEEDAAFDMGYQEWRLSHYRSFGRVLANFCFFLRYFQWPRRLDCTIFLQALYRHSNKQYTPPSKNVTGKIGEAMMILDNFARDGGRKAELPPIFMEIKEAYSLPLRFMHYLNDVTKTSQGCELIKTRLYQQTQWTNRDRALSALTEGLNEAGLLDAINEAMSTDDLAIADVEAWLQQSKVPTAAAVLRLTNVRRSWEWPTGSGSVNEQRFLEIKDVFDKWISDATVEELTWFIDQATGSTFACCNGLSVRVYSDDETGWQIQPARLNYVGVGFSACSDAFNISLAIFNSGIPVCEVFQDIMKEVRLAGNKSSEFTLA